MIFFLKGKSLILEVILNLNRKMRLILASKSPRRKRILNSLGLCFEVIPSLIDESTIKIKDPVKLVLKLAKIKALDVAKNVKHEIVIGADTIVVLNGEIIGKPENKEDAYEIISKLSGRKHFVYTGI